jgi:nitrite reductase/ring-hydroxylating ferredoxin subunit
VAEAQSTEPALIIKDEIMTDIHRDDQRASYPIAPNAPVAIPLDGPDPLDRRTFLSRAMLGVAVMALAACGASDATAPFTGTATINVSDYPALATVGGVALVTLNGSPLAIVRDSATSVVALSRVCPHQGATVNTSTNGFTCPRHGAQFDKTGVWQGGQRTTNMRSYATTFDESTGVITVG